MTPRHLSYVFVILTVLLPVVRFAQVYSAVLNFMGKVGPVPEGMSLTSALRNVWYSKKHDAVAARLTRKAVLFQSDIRI
jgi:hypothetical protein